MESSVNGSEWDRPDGMIPVIRLSTTGGILRRTKYYIGGTKVGAGEYFDFLRSYVHDLIRTNGRPKQIVEIPDGHKFVANIMAMGFES